ncbi:MAG: DUF3592 domain-containing protein [Eubacteriales bacterium]
MNGKVKSSSSIVFVIIFALIFIGVGVYLSVRELEFVNGGTKTQATIVDIETYYDSNGDLNHRVYVTYDVDGTVYSGILDTYTSSMRAGKTIPVYYMTDNPSEFTYAKLNFLFPVIFILCGVLVLVFSIIPTVSDAKSNRKLKLLKESGRRITAIVEDVQLTGVTVMGRRQTKIVCRDEQGRIYKKKFLASNTENISIGGEISVYVDYENPENYAIDV